MFQQGETIMSIVATDPPRKRLASPGEFMELAMPLDVRVCVSNEEDRKSVV
jgi:hypothetical protein